MTFKKQLNKFLRFVYSVLSRILMIASVIFLICIFLAIIFNLNFDIPSLITLGIIFVCIISYVVFNKRLILKAKKQNQSWFFLQEILKVAAILFVFGVFVTQLKLPEPLVTDKIGGIDETEEVFLYTDSTETTIEKYYQSKQTWYDFNRRKHAMRFRVDYDSVQKSKAYREAFRVKYAGSISKKIIKSNKTPNAYIYYWTELYRNLVKNDKPLVENLASEFYDYQIQQKLDRKQFAELMITAIQDIPYGLVISDSCKVDSVKPCIGNIEHGLFSPAEYVSNLHGDCDTRTVLLYTLLSRFNYDVAILNSLEYHHSILGLNIPSAGKYKTYKHKKYYFVETTGRGWSIGALPKDFSNIDNWDFILVHNTNI